MVGKQWISETCNMRIEYIEKTFRVRADVIEWGQRKRQADWKVIL